MPSVHVAATAPINPAGAEPVLTGQQVWQALRRKVRHATEFVPVIRLCEVVREEGPVVTRRVAFEGREDRPVTEVCTELAPCRVDFAMEDGGRVQNILAPGPGGEDDLYLTYAFIWPAPEVAEGSEEMAALEAKQQKMAIVAVLKTVQVMREMVKDGRIQ